MLKNLIYIALSWDLSVLTPVHLLLGQKLGESQLCEIKDFLGLAMFSFLSKKPVRLSYKLDTRSWWGGCWDGGPGNCATVSPPRP